MLNKLETINGAAATAAPKISIQAPENITKVQDAALSAIQNVELPSSGPSILKQSGIPDGFAEKVSYNLPVIDIAYEAIKLGLKAHGKIHEDILRYVDKAEEHQKTIALLLDFQSELSKNPQEPTEKINTLIAQLKERDIEIEFSKDRITELKSLLSARKEKEQSDIQIIFTTKLQVKTQHMGSLNDVLKDIIRYNSRLLSTITGNQAKR